MFLCPTYQDIREIQASACAVPSAWNSLHSSFMWLRFMSLRSRLKCPCQTFSAALDEATWRLWVPAPDSLLGVESRSL